MKHISCPLLFEHNQHMVDDLFNKQPDGHGEQHYVVEDWGTYQRAKDGAPLKVQL